MALRQDDNDMKVDPENGIYVEMEGIMEWREVYDDSDEYKSQDMFFFQEENQYIPQDFCVKNKEEGVQNIFFCLVCNCELKSLIPLRAHCVGAKHIRKALEKKRAVLGLKTEPQNAPQRKKQKPPKERVDVCISLENRLREIDDPVLGLSNITEIRHPRDRTAHPWYTCSQEGCKSAWGNSDDMFNHVKNHKHQKNFLKLKYDDPRIDSLTKNEILIQAMDYANDQNILDAGDRDYQAIKLLIDLDEYLKLKNRPATWSENKEKLGLVGNTNYEPIIPRKRRNHDPEETSPKRVCGDQFAEGWNNWRARTDQEILLDRQRDVELLFNMCREIVNNHLANPAEESFKLCKQEISELRVSNELDLQIFEDDFFATKLAELNHIEEKVQLGLDEEEKAGKDINQGLLDLEQEMHLYASDRESRAYKNYKERLATLTGQIQKFKPWQPAMLKRREEFNTRLAEIWKNFEDRSESVVEIQNKAKNTGGAAQGGNINGSVSASNTAGSSNVSASKLRQEERSRFTAEFKVEVLRLVEVEVANAVSIRIDKQEIINKLVDRILPMEEAAHSKKNLEWSMFKMTEKIKTRIINWIKSYIVKKYPSS